MVDETWLPVAGFEGYYEVSNLGRVRRDAKARDWRSRGETLKPVRQHTGYYHVLLSVRGQITGRTVHSLVMEAFVGPRPAGYETNHKDGDKQNCRLDNLEYLTISENRLHAVRTGLRRLGSEHWTYRYPAGHPGGRKLTEEMMVSIREAAEQGEPQERLAAQYGVSRRAVQKVIHGQAGKHLPGPVSPIAQYAHPSDEQLREMLACLDQGESKVSVARRFGVSRAYLYKVLNGKLRSSALRPNR